MKQLTMVVKKKEEVNGRIIHMINSKNKEKHKILLVDDDPHILEIGTDLLESNGYQVSTAVCGENAIEIMEKENFDLVITDLIMGQVNGLAVLKRVKKLDPNRKAIIVTGSHDITHAIEAIRLDVDDFLLKPFRGDEFLQRVSHCLEGGTDRQGNKSSAA
jgi:DNA-binding NtrC family response regulator